MTPRLPVRAPLLPTLAALVLLGGCAATRTYIAPPYEEATTPAPLPEATAYTVYLLGNTGDGEPDDAAPVLLALARELDDAGENSAVVFLGDQLDDGLPDPDAAGRAEAEDRLRALAQAVHDYEGRVFAVPGDRDWNGGADAVERQEAFLEGLLGRDDVFAPGDGLAGPAVLELHDGFVLALLDTAWWLEDDDERRYGDAADLDGDEGDYEIENPGDVVRALEDALREYDDEYVLAVGHHPLVSNGPYGGQYTLGQHLLPLPVLGSAYRLFRGVAGGRQDLSGTRYRALRRTFGEAFLARDGVAYAAAHERSLQVFPIEESLRRTQHYLISGSAAETTPVAAGRGAAYAASSPGFMRLHYLDGGAVWLDVLTVADGTATVALRTQLRERPRENVDPEVPDVDPASLPSYRDSTVTAVLNPDYDAGGLQRAFVGEGYRDAWTTPLPFPVLDLSQNGGLRAVQRGGGMQTVSLRLEDPEGHQYVLRIVDKVAGQTLPEELRSSLAADIIQDLTSATLPWGAVAVAELAEAAGIYHTNPQIVYVPDDPRLGRYRDTFAGQLALFEMRPDDDKSDFPNFGSSDDVVSSRKLFEETREDNDHRVDQRFYVRNRLFDMLLSDWDRHPDQWRWASFEPGALDPSLTGDAATDGKIYRPIPRDRDFAFYRFDGLLGGIARQINPKFQIFGPNYGNIPGLTTSGIPLDRRFTTDLSRQEWIAEAEALRASLTDEAIEAAFLVWPDFIYERYADRTIALLKERRDKLPRVAEEVYELYASFVDVVGSDKRERFEVTRLDDGFVEVVMYDSNDEGERNAELYRRVFDPRETREVRLYGRGAGDFFHLDGDGAPRIIVRIIGGPGDDTFTNRTNGRRAVYYDTERGNELDGADGARLVLSDDPETSSYRPGDYKHPDSAILVQPGYNRTDGFVIGGGYVWNRPGFRRHPWASTHTVMASFATTTGGVAGGYDVRYYDRFGRGWDAHVAVEGSTPRYVRNFYGLGNDTGMGSSPSSFFHVDLTEAEARASIIRQIEDAVEVTFGGLTAYTKAEDDSTRFAGTPAAMLPASAFEGQWHAGGFVEVDLQTVDSAVNPRQGFQLTLGGRGLFDINEAAAPYGSVYGDVVLYVPLRLEPQATLAARAGGGHLFGDFPFFAAQTLGGRENLRGLVRQRYSGRTAAYQSAELRLKLFRGLSYVVPSDFGVLAFADNGRVWADDQSSSTWHQGFGGGLWMNALDAFVLTGTVASGDDGVLFNFGLGFLF